MNYSTDVLIIGSGGAGLRAAIELHASGRRVLVLGKRPKTDAHTVLAEGGINAALGTLDPADTWAIHAADTLKEGRFLGHPAMVERLCREAPGMIAELERWGVPFAREADGRLSQRFFGAHRYRRTCFVGDYTGLEIIKALVRETDRRQIPILERVYASHLLTTPAGPGQRRVNGALGFRLEDGAEVVVQAGAVLLATGGHTHVYRRSTSRRRESTGDGMALAFAVGAPLADMELVQFHPSGMVWPPELDGMLVTEAVRGEGGQLRNQAGERFMPRYDPQRLELSTRDRVALANYAEIAAGRGTAHGGVWLDISHQPAELIRARLPHMLEQFAAVGVDITRQPMEVAPTAHYSMGGVRVDPETHATPVPGLFAAGEVTAGVHGANRLGGNSLSEILVFGRIAAEQAGRFAAQQPAPPLDETVLAQPRQHLARLRLLDGARQRALIADLQILMWECAGVVRDAAGLERGLSRLAAIRQQAETADASDLESARTSATLAGPAGANSLGVISGQPAAPDLSAALDLRAMLLTAEATLRSALLRAESRGAHQRRDYPETDPAWQRTIVVQPAPNPVAGGPSMLLTTAELPPPAAAVALAHDETHLDLAGRLLE